MIPRHFRGIFFLGSTMSNRASSQKNSYIILNKPYGVLCQFSDKSGRETLHDLGPFPSDVYPVGRLDSDSEGLLLLTNDNFLKHRLIDPHYGHKRTYLAQVERVPSREAVDKLRSGVMIEGRKTREAEVRLLQKEPGMPTRETPIRFRKGVPTAWLEITLTEGRNRQVRKMTASVGHPTLRLVRTRFGPLILGRLRPGEHRHLSVSEIQALLVVTTRSKLPPSGFREIKFEGMA
jgi:23S rRNA pseudouridine2457 synthase